MSPASTRNVRELQSPQTSTLEREGGKPWRAYLSRFGCSPSLNYSVYLIGLSGQSSNLVEVITLASHETFAVNLSQRGTAMALLQGIAECLVRRDAIASGRESPGILVFSASLQLLYMNREAQELTKRLHQAQVENHEKGLLPFEVMSLCKDLVALFRTRVHPKDWEQMQLTRVAGVQKCPVLLRGVKIPSHASPHQGCFLILMEVLQDQQETTGASVLERYHLTKREETVLSYLL